MPNSRNAEATADSTRYFRPPSSGHRLFTGYAIIAYSGTLSSSKPMNNDAKCVAQASVRDRKSVVQGKSVSVRVDLGGRRIITKKNRLILHRHKRVHLNTN